MTRPFDPISIRSLTDLQRHMRDEGEAQRLFEWLRWPEGRVCPFCGSGEHWALTARRAGLYECRGCGRQFSATAGTPLHGTKLPIATWIQAAFLIVSSSKGMSSPALARHLGITQRSAWKIGHAIRLLMNPAAGEAKLSGIVEADDIADGGKASRRNRAKYGEKAAKFIYNAPGRGSGKKRILVAVERGGRVRTAEMTDGSASAVGPLVRELVAPEAHLMTDGDRALIAVGKDQAAHASVSHSQKEYVRGDAHVNTAEAFNLFLRRAKMGVWHVWSNEHLRRYLAELQFHWDHRPIPKGSGKRRELVAVPSIVLMRILFSRGHGRELRRTKAGSVAEPSHRPGKPAPKTH